MKKNKEILLTERIVVIGIKDTELKSFVSKKNFNVHELKNLQPFILEEYNSIHLVENKEENYKKDLCSYCLIDGVKVSEESKYFENNIHTFALIYQNTRKHCSCLTFYENYEAAGVKFAVLKAICIISNLPIYNTQKEILQNLFSILSNYKTNKMFFQDKLNLIFLKEKAFYTVLKEINNLDFYFSYILNCMKVKANYERSYFVNYLGNNSGKKTFMKFHIDEKFGYPIPDIDITLLLDKFNVEDIIKIYIGLLMEYKIILVFSENEDVNLIIWSLLSLIYPLKWNLPIISFISPSMTDFLETPFSIIAGVPSNMIQTLSNQIKMKSLNEESLVYNLSTKRFIYLPDKYPEFPMKITNELRSNIYLILSDKLSFTSDYENNDTELTKLFEDDIIKQMDLNVYLNLKFIQIFFNIFIELIKNIENSISYEKLRNFKPTERLQIYDVFNFQKFSSDREFFQEKKYMAFIDQFSKTQMFTEFLENFIRYHDKKPKYQFIKNFLSIHKLKRGNKNVLKETNREYIKNKIINYYDFQYYCLDEPFKNYVKLQGTDKSKLNEKMLWNQLDPSKISKYSIKFEDYLIDDNDERIKTNPNRQLFLDMIALKEYKSEDFDDETVDRKQISVSDIKTKANIEEFFNRTYGQNSGNSSNSINFDENRKFSVDANSLKGMPVSKSINISNVKKFPMFIEKENVKIIPQPNSNKVINKVENKIENYYFNNININSSDIGTSINTMKSIPMNNMNFSQSKIDSKDNIKVIKDNSKEVKDSKETRDSKDIKDDRKKLLINLKEINKRPNISVSSDLSSFGIDKNTGNLLTNSGTTGTTTITTKNLDPSKIKQGFKKVEGASKISLITSLNPDNNKPINYNKHSAFSGLGLKSDNKITISNPKQDYVFNSSILNTSRNSAKKINNLVNSDKIQPQVQKIRAIGSDYNTIKSSQNLKKLAGDDEVDIFNDEIDKVFKDAMNK